MAIAARRQPQGLVRLNRSHPLARGLVHAWGARGGIRGAFRDAAGSADCAFGVGNGGTTGTYWRYGPGGAYMLFSDSGTGTTSSKNAFVGDGSGSGWPKTNVFSIQARVNIASFGSTPTIYVGNSYGNLSFQISSAGNPQIFAPGVGIVATSTGTIQAGVDCDVGVDIAASAITFYINGIPAGTTASTQTFAQGGQAWLGGDNIANNSRIYFVNVWNRSRSADEYAAMYRAPWSIYDAPSQTQFPQPSLISQAFAAFRNFLHF